MARTAAARGPGTRWTSARAGSASVRPPQATSATSSRHSATTEEPDTRLRPATSPIVRAKVTTEGTSDEASAGSPQVIEEIGIMPTVDRWRTGAPG